MKELVNMRDSIAVFFVKYINLVQSVWTKFASMHNIKIFELNLMCTRKHDFASCILQAKAAVAAHQMK